MAHLLRRNDHAKLHEPRQKACDSALQKSFLYSFPDDPKVGIEIIDVPDNEETELRSSIHSHITKTLAYPSMKNAWRKEVMGAHPQTFEWVFEGPTEEQPAWSDLSNWLKAEGVIFGSLAKQGRVSSP